MARGFFLAPLPGDDGYWLAAIATKNVESIADGEMQSYLRSHIFSPNLWPAYVSEIVTATPPADMVISRNQKDRMPSEWFRSALSLLCNRCVRMHQVRWLYLFCWRLRPLSRTGFLPRRCDGVGKCGDSCALAGWHPVS